MEMCLAVLHVDFQLRLHIFKNGKQKRLSENDWPVLIESIM